MHTLFAAAIGEDNIHNVLCARMLVRILVTPSNMLVKYRYRLCATDQELMAQPHDYSTNASINVPC